MEMRRQHYLFIAGFILVVALGYWLAGTAAPPPKAANEDAQPASIPQRPAIDEEMPKFRRSDRPDRSGADFEALAAGAFDGERVIVFRDAAALADFLRRAGNQVSILGRLDALNALRVGFEDYDDLASLLDGDEEESMIFPVNSPPPLEGSVQPGATALGNGLLDWLGIGVDNSAWGNGVKIAVLDTGVTAHPAFKTDIQSINLVDLPADSASQNGHGTAVASVIIGNDPFTPGVAPGAEMISVRIADDNGQSDSFLLAKGIVAAVDAGARLINISMGSFGDSALVRNAIQYATNGGAMIIAAAGNNGLERVAYPAANEGVIGVGGVDAMGNHLAFSNAGETIDISAPGFGVNAAWVGDQAASVNGTSFSAPIVTGALAAIMTEAGNQNLSPAQAWKLLSSHLNDGAAAGSDPQLGAGMPDIGRVLSASTRGIYDAALASHRILPPDAGNPYGQVEILVQNRGTETLINTSVEISTGSSRVTSNLTTLAPGAVQTVRVPISQSAVIGATPLNLDSRVVLSGGLRDSKPSNDRRSESYMATTPP